MPSIKVEPVFTGTYYLEVPQANLRVLCGTPADSVKKLIQLQIIRPIEKNGVRFESGPNAILLSDTSTQNGQLSNLTEFPVLQMLYRQGMLIPNHPNNNGVRPILLGQTSQLISQMEYINIGNYGIDNLMEMKDAGLKEHEAKEILRFKKRFAFGKFKSPDELIEFKPVELSEPTEILNGVYVKRLETNVFEFSYGDETEVIDLNLRSGEYYDPIYPLGYYNVNREFFSVVHSGQGDGWNATSSCMSSVLVHSGKIYLLDAGPNVGHVLKALGIGLNELVGLFLTHVHDDHFNGIASLMALEHRLTIYTTPIVRKCLTKKLSSLLSLSEFFFSDFFNFIDLSPGEWNALDSLEVMPLLSPHPVETYNYLFRCISNEGYKTYAHLADTVSFDVLDAMVEDDLEKPGITAAAAQAVKENYLTPVDLKKVDVGGGMIHGSASDYANDTSGKIVLAHTSGPIMDPAALSVGSEAHFGSVDVLIDTHFDYLRESAKVIVERYFEMIPPNALKHLLNNPIVQFYPGSIVYKPNEKLVSVYLILTGLASTVMGKKTDNMILGVGDFIGAGSMTGETHASQTYRTDTFLNALAIPLCQIEHLIAKHKVAGTLIRSANHRKMLLTSPLFQHNISKHLLNLIAKSMNFMEVGPSEEDEKKLAEIVAAKTGQTFIFVVMGGRIAMGTQSAPAMFMLEKGDFFGESVVYGFKEFFSFKPLKKTCLYLIPYDQICGIPSVFQMLLERYDRSFNHLIAQFQSDTTNRSFESEVCHCDLQVINAANQKLKLLFGAISYFKFIGDVPILLRAIHNMGVYFNNYADLKQSKLLMFNHPKFKEIRMNHKEFATIVKTTAKSVEKNGELADEEFESLRDGLSNVFGEVIRFRSQPF